MVGGLAYAPSWPSPEETTKNSETTRLFVTRGDDVQHIQTIDELRTFLLPIDAPAKAVFLASQWFRAYHQVSAEFGFDCATGQVETFGEGYRVLLRHRSYPCRPSRSSADAPVAETLGETWVYIGRNGALSMGEHRTIAMGPSAVCHPAGRRPLEYRVEGARNGANPLGQTLTEMADLEAASIPSFARLAEELAWYGAPEALVAAARRAQKDEVRHARSVGRLAERFGGRRPKVPAISLQPRALLVMALENATEGCVREVVGALLSSYQKDHATCRPLARLLGRISDDETRHGELALAVERWVTGLLTEEEKEVVRRAKGEAVANLMASVSEEPEGPSQRPLGLPPAAVACALAEALQKTRWPETVASAVAA